MSAPEGKLHPTKALCWLLLTALTGVSGWLLGGEWKSGRIAGAEGTKREAAAAGPAETSKAASKEEGTVDPRVQQAVKDPASFSKREAMERLFAEHPGTPKELERLLGIYAELNDLDVEEYSQAIAMARQQEKAGRYYERAQMIAGLWAERDPVEAATWMLQTSPTCPIFGAFVEEILGTWGRMNPDAMFEWLSANHGRIAEAWKDEFAFGFSKAAAKIDPERGRKWIETIQPKRLSSFYMHWAQHAPMAAGAAVLKEADENLRRDGVEMVAIFWAGASRDPSAAAEWARQIPDPLLADQTLVNIGTGVSHRNKGEGLDFLARLPQTNRVRESMETITAAWSGEDLPAALHWALSQENEPLGRWVLGRISEKAPAEKVAKAIETMPAEKRDAIRRWQAGSAEPKREIPLPAK
jgi:hypothetical protein